ncbi:hypothetical protein GF322_02945 [Candidatus Dependentiae bacterium]|nr:hypothetical protein [Candidatus Dependentiae bacterium]
MIILFKEWQKTFSAIFSMAFPFFFERSFKQFWTSIKTFFRYFGWILILNIIFSFLFAEQIFKITKFLAKPPAEQIGLTFYDVLFYFLILITLFILSTGFILIVRRPNSINFQYVKTGFFRYVQISLIFSFSIFFIVNILFSFGVSNFPKLHWIIISLLKLIGFLVIFYWFDSNFGFKDILFSLENALNLILYKLPFFIILFFLFIGSNYLVSILLDFFLIKYNYYDILSGISYNTFYEILPKDISFVSIAKLLLIKYFSLLLNFIFITFIFVYYSIKKKETYTNSIFEIHET